MSTDCAIDANDHPLPTILSLSEKGIFPNSVETFKKGIDCHWIDAMGVQSN